MTTRMAVIGAGQLARVRARALLAAGDVELCGVAARTAASAEKFAAEFEIETHCDAYPDLLTTQPDAVLVEVPHGVQDEIVLWALQAGLHVLVGGCPATSAATAERIVALTEAEGLVFESGYEARYAAAWQAARDLVVSGNLGDMVAVRTLALWDGDPATWYYSQQASGGMPLTHMTYAFLNPSRWVVGNPVRVSAFANRIKHTGPGLIDQETCVANLVSAGDVLWSVTAGFVVPGEMPAWRAMFLATEGAVEVFPQESRLVVYRDTETKTLAFSDAEDAFEAQARTFVRSLHGPDACRNGPREGLVDVRLAEAIVRSCETRESVDL